MNTFDVDTFDVGLYDQILARGLSKGVGQRDGSMCIEAAICTVLGLDHGDDPQCVSAAVRRFKIRLNDARWSSPQARSEGLRDLGLAQLGSLGVVEDKKFASRVVKRIIQEIIPDVLETIFPGNPEVKTAAEQCRRDGTLEAVRKAKTAAAAYAAAAYAADAHAATDAAAYAAYAADAAVDTYAAADAVACAADAAAYAAAYAADSILKKAATIALDILRELNSPGCRLLKGERP